MNVCNTGFCVEYKKKKHLNTMLLLIFQMSGKISVGCKYACSRFYDVRVQLGSFFKLKKA